MSLQACADLVAKGDPDRFAAAMAAPVAARRVLFPIYAFNLEVARAPWVTSEPMIGEMRLQWWRDALEEISGRSRVRRHEVTDPLADALDGEGARVLDRLVAARRWDLYTEAFADQAHFDDYMDATGGGLMWVAARALGGTDEATFRAVGRASALANLFLAIPELEARGRKPLVDGRPEAVAQLARSALSAYRAARIPKAGRAATIAAWRAPTLLAQAVRDPKAVAEARLGESALRKRFGLVRAAFRA